MLKEFRGNNSLICNCGSLYNCSKQRRSRVEYDEKSESYNLDLDDGLIHSIDYCLHCGGNDLITFHSHFHLKDLRRCVCGLVSTWAKNENIPVEYNQELNNYYLVRRDDGLMRFNYCVSCGSRLLEANQVENFIQPSEAELSDILKKLQMTHTLEDAIKHFGEPNSRINANFFEVNNVAVSNRWEDIKESLNYQSRYETIWLIINQYLDGQLGWFTGLKPEIKVQQN